MPSKRKSTKRKSVGQEQLIELGAAVASGESRREILAKHPEAPERLVRELQRVGLGVEEYRKKVEAEFQSAALESVASYREDLRQGKVSPNTKPIAAGIFADKAAGVHGAAALRSIDVSVTVNSYGSERSKEQILASLFPRPDPIPLLVENGDSAESIQP
jgi:hypothetical protein